MVNYRPQKFLGLLAPTQYARVTRLSRFSCESLAKRDYTSVTSLRMRVYLCLLRPTIYQKF